MEASQAMVEPTPRNRRKFETLKTFQGSMAAAMASVA
jgi:hypothetical protein